MWCESDCKSVYIWISTAFSRKINSMKLVRQKRSLFRLPSCQFRLIRKKLNLKIRENLWYLDGLSASPRDLAYMRTVQWTVLTTKICFMQIYTRYYSDCWPKWTWVFPSTEKDPDTEMTKIVCATDHLQPVRSTQGQD